MKKSSLNQASIARLCIGILVVIIVKQTIWYLDNNYEKMHSGYFECLIITSCINILQLVLIGVLDIKYLKKLLYISIIIFILNSVIKSNFEKENLEEFAFYFHWKETWPIFIKFLWHFCLDILVLFTVAFIKIFFMKLGNISKRA